MNRNDLLIPAVVRASPELPELWGRLASLSPQEAELITQFGLPAGRVVTLSFEFAGEKFEDVRARVTRAPRDPDGYYACALAFLDAGQRDALRAAVLRAAPFSPPR